MAWPLVIAGALFGVFPDHDSREESHAGGDRNDICRSQNHRGDLRRRDAALGDRSDEQARDGVTTKRSGRAVDNVGHPDRERIDRRRGRSLCLLFAYFKFKDVPYGSSQRSLPYLFGIRG